METLILQGGGTSASLRAHAESVKDSIADIATFLAEVLGRKLTAFISGVSDQREVARWADGSHAPRAEAERRLRAAYQVFQLLQAAESPRVVRAWFIGMNPQLDDASPAEALAEGELREVIAAARAFVAGG